MITVVKQNWEMQYEPRYYNLEVELLSDNPIDYGLLERMQKIKGKEWGLSSFTYDIDQELQHQYFFLGELKPVITNRKYRLKICASGKRDFQKNLTRSLKRIFGDQWVK